MPPYADSVCAARSLQSCPALCDPVGCSPPGSSVRGILQARILESWLPCPPLGDPPHTGIEHTSPVAPASRADSLPFEPQGKPKSTGVGSLSLRQQDLPAPGTELGSPALQEDSLRAELSGKSKWTDKTQMGSSMSKTIGFKKLI